MCRRDWWIAALLSSCLAGSGCSSTKANEKAKQPPPEVYVKSPTFQVVTDYEEFIGHTEAVNTVQVMARVTGYLDKVNFQDGDEVEKGALLFQVDDRPYKAEHERMLATLEQGKARLARLTNDHNRANLLLARNAIGKEEFDLINGNFEEGKATVGVYTASLDRARLDLDFTQVIAPISGRLSRRMVDPGNLVKADTTILTSIVSLDPMYVYFDIDERTILKLRRLIAEGKIKSRTEAVLPVLVGLSDEPEANHPGTINFTDNKVVSSTGTLQVRGVIPNPKPRMLSPGLFVRIRLPVGLSHRSIMIDEQAIMPEQSTKYVYVVKSTLDTDKDPKTKKPIIDPATGKPKQTLRELAFKQTIKVGTLAQGQRVVNEGLAEGDRIIISGLQRVKVGEEVRPVLAKVDGDVPAKGASGTVEPTPPPASNQLPAPANAEASASKHPVSEPAK
jgi:membrane fusion protein, multidrug efflux system